MADTKTVIIPDPQAGRHPEINPAGKLDIVQTVRARCHELALALARAEGERAAIIRQLPQTAIITELQARINEARGIEQEFAVPAKQGAPEGADTSDYRAQIAELTKTLAECKALIEKDKPKVEPETEKSDG